jgi:hypothetical protein
MISQKTIAPLGSVSIGDDGVFASSNVMAASANKLRA